MSLQDSTFNTTHVLDNEIVKANDFEFAFENLINNVSKATQMFLESNQDFVINGKVLPYEGMNVQISPIYGVCKANGLPFGRTETAVMEYGFEESSSGRIDIIEVQGGWETYDNQQRAFNDPDTDTQTYQYVDTKKLMRPVYRIKKGVEGANVAPEVDENWVKLAEVVIEANSSEITEENIKNITSDVAGLPNTDWTTQPTITYNIGYISDINARFRVQHNEDGTHKDDVIDTDSLNIGVGTKQVNGNVLPVGSTVSIPGETVAATDSMLSVFTKIAAMITSLYNAYLKYGDYGFKGSLSVSSIADANNVLTKPITIIAAGDGTATIKIDNATVLSIDSTGKLSTNGYTATSANNIVTKAVTDAITTALNNLTQRVTNLENVADSSLYANGTLSMGDGGRFNLDSNIIYVATTQNIVLSNLQTIDGFALTSGVYVLVKDQTNAKENGIYEVGENLWQRVASLNTPDKIKGKLFLITNGTTNGGKIFYIPKVNFNAPSSFGTDDINFLEYMGTPKPLANRVVLRDTCGRAQVAAPSASNDIARKAEIDNLYGNVAGLPLGTAAVGTANTFARSDHVHPIPTYVACAGDACRAYKLILGTSATDAIFQGGASQASSPVVVWGTNDGVNMYQYSTGCLCVGHATSASSAESASYAGLATCASCIAINGLGYGDFCWDGQTGQPSWLWGTNDGLNIYPWNPANFSVAYADCTNSATSAESATYAGLATCASCIAINGLGYGDFCWDGQTGQPSWLWGTNDGLNIYPWNPANFSVAYADCTNSATSAGYATNAGDACRAYKLILGTSATDAIFQGGASQASSPVVVWGTSDGINMYQYSTGCLCVGYASGLSRQGAITTDNTQPVYRTGASSTCLCNNTNRNVLIFDATETADSAISGTWAVAAGPVQVEANMCTNRNYCYIVL